MRDWKDVNIHAIVPQTKFMAHFDMKSHRGKSKYKKLKNCLKPAVHIPPCIFPQKSDRLLVQELVRKIEAEPGRVHYIRSRTIHLNSPGEDKTYSGHSQELPWVKPWFTPMNTRLDPGLVNTRHTSVEVKTYPGEDKGYPRRRQILPQAKTRLTPDEDKTSPRWKQD